jgi:hypothetical protein
MLNLLFRKRKETSIGYHTSPRHATTNKWHFSETQLQLDTSAKVASNLKKAHNNCRQEATRISLPRMVYNMLATRSRKGPSLGIWFAQWLANRACKT